MKQKNAATPTPALMLGKKMVNPDREGDVEQAMGQRDCQMCVKQANG